jgi:hypothetical protein
MMLPRLAAAAALVALAHTQHQQPSPPTVSPGCDSEAELLESLRWLHDACAEEGEPFDEVDALVPRTVTTRSCAEVVRRVASDCGGLLARSLAWFQSRRAALRWTRPSLQRQFWRTLAGWSARKERSCSSIRTLLL